ncbi:hypothetical protein C8Q77DRAFT_1153416 [Trametes polyzona]|nr:hypothetical protein C8Q77DRAFT_1153416 [Trametes polyzona]
MPQPSSSSLPLAAFALVHSLFASTVYGAAGPTFNATTNATCFSGYDWMNNERNQSPCLVAAYLLAPCTSSPSGANIPALNGPQSLYNFAGTELESSTYYIVSENCTNGAVTFPQYNGPISSQTSVPAWAYQAFNVGRGRLDIHEAKRIAAQDLPDATTPGIYGPSASALQPEAAPCCGSSEGPDIGLVVGATVGGLLGFIALLVGLTLLVRAVRRRRRGQMFLASGGHGTVPVGQVGEGMGQDALLASARLYNPDDPMTYPGVDDKAGVPQQHGRGGYAGSPPPSWESTQPRPQAGLEGAPEYSYSGRPEIA